ncbi:MAG: 6-phosphogluconolactonase [Chloroflexi bacterium]|nr:6-phosphogluconolactonase [Chloroflexota bacterium]
MAGPRIDVVENDHELGRRGAEYVFTSVERAIDERGHAHVALTGGSTAVTLYRAIASSPDRDRIDWRNVDLWWGDDRFVPFDHPESNVGLVQDTLLGSQLLNPPAIRGQRYAQRPSAAGNGGRFQGPGEEPAGIVVPLGNVHPFPIPEAQADGSGRDGCARMYAGELTALMPLDARGLPIFDLVLLGVGLDGHFLSCFPGSPLVDAPAPPICSGAPAPTTASPHVPRVTISPRLTEIARDMLVLASGESKAGIISTVLTGPRDPNRYPSQIAARQGATWMLDAAAASQLAEPMRSAR